MSSEAVATPVTQLVTELFDQSAPRRAWTLLGWGVGRAFRLDAATGRALAFSAATRNSLVVLPLAFAVPSAMPLLPAVIVTQTLIELVSELIYVQLMPILGRPSTATTPTT